MIRFSPAFYIGCIIQCEWLLSPTALCYQDKVTPRSPGVAVTLLTGYLSAGPAGPALVWEVVGVKDKGYMLYLLTYRLVNVIIWNVGDVDMSKLLTQSS